MASRRGARKGSWPWAVKVGYTLVTKKAVPGCGHGQTDKSPKINLLDTGLGHWGLSGDLFVTTQVQGFSGLAFILSNADFSCF